MDKAKSEDAPVYGIKIDLDQSIINQALAILAARLGPKSDVFSDPASVKSYLRLRIGGLEYETFTVMFLNAQHGLIGCVDMFRGTIDQTSVYPREIVKEALRRNAAAVVFSHNHPSGSVEPSRADTTLTATLKAALALVDVRVLDHVIVSPTGDMSFAERGLI